MLLTSIHQIGQIVKSAKARFVPRARVCYHALSVTHVVTLAPMYHVP